MSFGKLRFLLPVAFFGAVEAATVSIDSYSYLTGPHPNYPDTGGSELTDGVDATVAWFPGSSTSASDVIPLAGWLLSDPSIQFNFDGAQTIGAVTVWLADSNGSAGVGVPSTLTVRTPDSSFSKTINVIDPPGAGSTVPVTISGFEVVTNSLVVEATRAQSWTMLSEVTFAVPEPSSVTMVMLGAIGLGRRRR